MLDGNRRVVRRGKALSPTVVLSPGSPRLAFVGQKGEGGFYPVDVMPEPGDITVQDLSGSVLFRITGMGPVAKGWNDETPALRLLPAGSNMLAAALRQGSEYRVAAVPAEPGTHTGVAQLAAEIERLRTSP